MKKIGYVMLLGLLGTLLLGGCEKEEKVAIEVETEEKTEEKTKPSYSFRDVLGTKYEAPLLTQLPKNTYEDSRLVNQNGMMVYQDKKGKVVSQQGIDVSKYQTNIDWKAVKESGIDFVMVRIGFRGYGDGMLHLDEAFISHVEGAQKENLGVGVYFFSQAITEEEAKEEADFVMSNIQKYAIAYPVVFDTEEIKGDVARTDHLTKEQYTKQCIAFCDQVKKAGYQPMIYANMKWLAFSLNLEELQTYPMWYADYEAKPQCPYAFQMWQYTESGTVPGIEGKVDRNLLFPAKE
ncbi:MAG: glycoside hydrolase family 25 protein [Lachnospiraceae bacterium]